MQAKSMPQPRRPASAAVRLVCLPYAGGGAAPFYRWRGFLPDWIELVPVSLPGHDGRLQESPRTDLRALAHELADEMVSVITPPFVLCGYSMGAWLAYQLTRDLGRRGASLPKLLIVAASRAPHEPVTQPPLHGLSDDAFLNALERRYDGIPAAVRNSPELLRLLLPSLRADVQMVETYDYAEERPLDVDILALGGADDPHVSPTQLEGWRRHTMRTFSAQVVPGGHFFLFPNRVRLPSAAASPLPEAALLQLIVDHLQHCRVRSSESGPIVG